MSKTEDFEVLQKEIGEVERMLKALIKSLQNKHLDPAASGIWPKGHWPKGHLRLRPLSVNLHCVALRHLPLAGPRIPYFVLRGGAAFLRLEI